MHFTLAELLLDLVQNAADAGSRTVRVTWLERCGRVELTVSDDGRGMPAQILAGATDPFYTDGVKHPGRTVGLGLAFLRQTAEATGGRFRLESEPGRGTTVGFEAPADHVDLPPAGDPVDALVLVLCTEGPDEISITREGPAGSYTVTRSELVEVLGNLSSVEGRGLLREYLDSQEEDIWQR
ncbi:MAG: sensor histidine kinase [Spirochaetota bacterium]